MSQKIGLLFQALAPSLFEEWHSEMIVQMEESIFQIQQRHSLLIAYATVALIHCVYLRTQHKRDTLYYSFCQSQSDSKKPGYLSTK